MIQTTERSNKRKIRTLSAFFVSFSPFRGARFTIRQNCGVRLGRRAKRKRGREKRKNIRRSEYSGVHPANFLSENDSRKTDAGSVFGYRFEERVLYQLCLVTNVGLVKHGNRARLNLFHEFA